MKIVILALGTRGDVQPFVALSLELLRRGHSVRLVSTRNFQSFVESFGLQFVALPENTPRDLEEVRAAFPNASAPLLAWHEYFKLLRAPRFLSAVWQACRDAELLLYTPLGFAGAHIAQALRIPVFHAAPQPRNFKRDYPDWAFGEIGGAPHHRFRSHVGRWRRISPDQSQRQFARNALPALNHWRQNELQLPAVSSFRSFGARVASKFPALFLYSRHVVPPHRGWPRHYHITGFFQLSSQSEEAPSEELKAFLSCDAPDERPIAICCGSGMSNDAPAFWNRVLDAVAQSGKRAVITRGRDAPFLQSPNERVFVADTVPLHWLMPHVSLLVSHGGIGTLAAAFHAGVPSLVLPFNEENWFWARAACAAGVALPPLSKEKMDAAQLAQKIRLACDDDALREGCARLQKLLQAENGVANAADLIEAEHARFHAK